MILTLRAACQMLLRRKAKVSSVAKYVADGVEKVLESTAMSVLPKDLFAVWICCLNRLGLL